MDKHFFRLVVVGLLGAAVHLPSPASAVTEWKWSFTTTIEDQFGSGNFTTADLIPTANVPITITGISGTYNRGGTANIITGLTAAARKTIYWDGTNLSPILADLKSSFAGPGLQFNTNAGKTVSLYNVLSNPYGPITNSSSFFIGSDGGIVTSRLNPVPVPLPALGIAATLTWSRRLRRRIQRVG